jgi:hypothetical protein
VRDARPAEIKGKVTTGGTIHPAQESRRDFAARAVRAGAQLVVSIRCCREHTHPPDCGETEVAVRDSRRSATLQAALQFVTVSDMPSAHKVILIEVLTQTMRDDERAELTRRAIVQAGAEWQDHEITHLKIFLQHRLARSWQHADECLMQIAAQLHRDPRSVRDKATQLGLCASVDYRYAKALQPGGE